MAEVLWYNHSSVASAGQQHDWGKWPIDVSFFDWTYHHSKRSYCFIFWSLKIKFNSPGPLFHQICPIARIKLNQGLRPAVVHKQQVVFAEAVSDGPGGGCLASGSVATYVLSVEESPRHLHTRGCPTWRTIRARDQGVVLGNIEKSSSFLQDKDEICISDKGTRQVARGAVRSVT